MQAIASNLMISFYHLLYHCTSFLTASSGNVPWSKDKDVLALCKGLLPGKSDESKPLVPLFVSLGGSGRDLLKKRSHQLLDQVEGRDYGARSDFTQTQLQFAIEFLKKKPPVFFQQIKVDDLAYAVKMIEEGSSSSSSGDSSSGSSSSGQPKAAGA